MSERTAATAEATAGADPAAEGAAPGAGVPAPAAAPEAAGGSPGGAAPAAPAPGAAARPPAAAPAAAGGPPGGAPPAAPAAEAGVAAADAGAPAAPDPETTPWTGRSAWVFPAVTAAFGLLGLSGLATIETPPHAASPGPTVFPAVVGALLLVLAACMAVVNVRVARRGPSAAPPLPPVEWRPTLIVLAALVAATALLQALGWLLTGALL